MSFSPRVFALSFMALALVGPWAARAEPSSDAALRPSPPRLSASPDPTLAVTVPVSLLMAGRMLTRLEMGLIDPMTRLPGGDIPAELALRSRLRLSPRVVALFDPDAAFQALAFQLELDLIDAWGPVGRGRAALAVDPSLHADAGFFGDVVEQAFVAARGRHVSLLGGLVRSEWGLGLVAGGGADPVPHTEGSPFGLPRRGDRVLRAAASVTPNGDGLGVSDFDIRIAVDAVIDDDFARWADGDRTWQAIVALSGRTEHAEAGFYLVHRSERHVEGGDTEATVLDGYLRWTLAREGDLEAFLAAEVAAIFGRTDHLLAAAFDRSLTLSQAGGIVRFGVHKGPFLGVFEGGFTSGDEDPFDDTIRAFAMDRDHRVGLVLFPELIASQTAGTYVNVNDPAWRRAGPRGADQIATLGAVRGAVYLNPRLSFEVDPTLHVYAGYVYAQQVGAWVDPFWSGLAGGAARGPRNGPPSDVLGHEVDLGVSWRGALGDALGSLRLEGAFCRPGGVFDGPGGEAARDIWAAWLFAGLGW
jgi:hypothetical protein